MVRGYAGWRTTRLTYCSLLLACCLTDQATGATPTSIAPPPVAPLNPRICFYDAARNDHLEGQRIFAEALRAAETRIPAAGSALATALEAVVDACLGQPERHIGTMVAPFMTAARRILALREASLGETHPDTIRALARVAAASFWERNRPDELQTYERLIRIRTQVLGPNHPETLDAEFDQAGNLVGLDRLKDAEALLVKVVRGREVTLGATHIEVGRSLMELSRIYERDGRSSLAVAAQRRALTIFEARIGKHPETLTAISALARNVARSEPAEASAIYSRELEMAEAYYGHDAPETLQRVLKNAFHAQDIGRFDDAEKYYIRMVEGRPDDAAGQTGLIPPLRELAKLYLIQGRSDEAQALLQRIATGLGSGNGDRLEFIQVLVLLGNSQRDAGDFAAAEETYRRAMREVEAAADLNDKARTFYSRLILSEAGILGVRQGRTADARDLFSLVQTCGRFRTRTTNVDSWGGLKWVCTDDDAMPASLWVGLAQAALVDGNYSSAVNHAERAYSYWEPSDSSPTLSIEGWEAAATLIEARLSARLLQIGAAPADAPARALADALRSHRSGASLPYVTRDAPLYFRLVADAARAASGGDEEVFKALQESMTDPATASMARTAGRRAAAEAGGALPALVEERERLASRLTALLHQVATVYGDTGGAGETDPEDLRKERGSVEARLLAVDEQLRRELPDYLALVNPQPLSLKQTQRLLGPEEAMLLVVPTQYGTHILGITREEVYGIVNTWANDIAVRHEVNKLRRDLGARVVSASEAVQDSGSGESGAGLSYNRDAANRLFELVVAPAAGTLSGRKRVYVVAAGALAGLPFSVLVTREPQGADNDPSALRSTSWFGDQHALVHLPSVQSLALLRRERRQTRPISRRGFVGFGDPVLDGVPANRQRTTSRNLPASSQVFRGVRSSRGQLLADPSELRRLTRLPGTAVELEAVRRVLRAPAESLFKGPRATETALRRTDLSQARLLLFSTHGLTDEEATGIGEPGLVMTPPEEATEQDDGYVSASEVTSLRLNADWVILSACNTATGAESQGLGALARAFFFAGAHNLLASHWPVSDAVAPILITRTLELERAGSPRAEAFQQAMREIRMGRMGRRSPSEWAHPFYWAPFVLIGEAGR